MLDSPYVICLFLFYEQAYDVIFFFIFTLDEPNNWTSSSVCDVVGNESLRLEDAQTVQLEDGTTAYIHHTAKGFCFFLFSLCIRMVNRILFNMCFN